MKYYVSYRKKNHVKETIYKRNMKKFFNELETLITCGCIAYILLRIVESL